VISAWVAATRAGTESIAPAWRLWYTRDLYELMFVTALKDLSVDAD
jgi:hypothetical protein